MCAVPEEVVLDDDPSARDRALLVAEDLVCFSRLGKILWYTGDGLPADPLITKPDEV